MILIFLLIFSIFLLQICIIVQVLYANSRWLSRGYQGWDSFSSILLSALVKFSGLIRVLLVLLRYLILLWVIMILILITYVWVIMIRVQRGLRSGSFYSFLVWILLIFLVISVRLFWWIMLILILIWIILWVLLGILFRIWVDIYVIVLGGFFNFLVKMRIRVGGILLLVLVAFPLDFQGGFLTVFVG